MKKLLITALVSVFAVAGTSTSAHAQTPAPVAAAPSAVGDWLITINTPEGAKELAVTLKADAGKITGSVKLELGEFPVTGTVDDKSVVFSFTVTYNGNPLTLTFSAPTPDDTIKGTVDFGGMASDSFAGKRVKAPTW